MAKKKRPPAVDAITPNQIVSYNLGRARRLRGWTQDHAADVLASYLPGATRWSKATFSVAEQSVKGRRVRQFTADDIVAFSRAFNLPISYFLLPPPPPEGGGTAFITTLGGDSPPDVFDLPSMLDHIFSTYELPPRFRELLATIPPELQHEMHRKYTVHTWIQAMSELEETIGPIEDVEAQLLKVVNVLTTIREVVAGKSEEMIEEATAITEEIMRDSDVDETGG